MRRPRPFVSLGLLAALLLVSPHAPVRAALPAKEPRLAWPTRDDVVARLQPSADAPRAGGARLGFVEPCLIYDERRSETGAPQWYYLVRQSNRNTAAGWVDARQVLTSSKAEIDPATNAPRFLVLTNTVLSLQEPESGEFVETPLRRAPHLDAAKSGTARLMELYFRYQTENGFVLIGNEPSFPPSAVPSATILGWVPENLTIPYVNRFGIEWARGSTLPDAQPRRPPSARIFRDRRDAYEARDEPLAMLFAEEADEDGVSLELHPSIPRMPLLPIDQDDDYPEIDLDTNNQLLHVAGLGALLGDKEKSPTRAEIAATNTELEKLRARLTTPLQVLFVIDDTRSMEKQFSRVADTVRLIFKDATRNPERLVQVAVSYYDDVTSGQSTTGYQARPLVDAGSDEGRNMLAEVDTHGQRLIEGMEYPEMLAVGLEHAIDAANFDAHPDASRLIVLIGDHGNRDPNSANVGDLPYDLLVKKLIGAGHGPLAFAAVQVVDPEEFNRPEGWQTAAKAFRDQLTKLKERLQAEETPAGRPVAVFIPTKDKGERLTELLNKQYNDMKKRETDLQKYRTFQEARIFPTRVGLKLKSLLKERGVPVARIESLAGVRVGHEGYLWRWQRPPLGTTSGVPQARVNALLSRTESRELAELLAPVLSTTDAFSALQKTVGSAPDATFDEAVLRPRGLLATSLILRRPVATLTRELVNDELPAVRARLARLQTLTDPAKTSKRWFRFRGGSSEWCWIDVESELP